MTLPDLPSVEDALLWGLQNVFGIPGAVTTCVAVFVWLMQVWSQLRELGASVERSGAVLARLSSRSVSAFVSMLASHLVLILLSAAFVHLLGDWAATEGAHLDMSRAVWATVAYLAFIDWWSLRNQASDLWVHASCLGAIVAGALAISVFVFGVMRVLGPSPETSEIIILGLVAVVISVVWWKVFAWASGSAASLGAVLRSPLRR